MLLKTCDLLTSECVVLKRANNITKTHCPCAPLSSPHPQDTYQRSAKRPPQSGNCTGRHLPSATHRPERLKRQQSSQIDDHARAPVGFRGDAVTTEAIEYARSSRRTYHCGARAETHFPWPHLHVVVGSHIDSNSRLQSAPLAQAPTDSS